MNEREMLGFIDAFMIDIKRRCYERMEFKPGDNVLDVGCGAGFDVQRIQRINGLKLNVLGVDLRHRLWKSSWGIVRTQGAGFVAADAAFLPFEKNTFDVIWADRLLQHMDDPMRALLEFKRVSKPDGRIVLADSDHTSARILCNGKVFGQPVMDFRASTIKSGFAGKMLKIWCQEVGLRVTSYEAIDIDIGCLELAKKLGLFFAGWDDKFRLGGKRRANELAHFLTEMERCDQQRQFRFNSKFHVIAACKE